MFQTNSQHKSVISNLIYPSHAIGHYGRLIQWLQSHCKQHLIIGSLWLNTRCHSNTHLTFARVLAIIVMHQYANYNL